MTQSTKKKSRLLTAAAIMLAILAIPFVLIGLAGAAQERRR